MIWIETTSNMLKGYNSFKNVKFNSKTSHNIIFGMLKFKDYGPAIIDYTSNRLVIY